MEFHCVRDLDLEAIPSVLNSTEEADDDSITLPQEFGLNEQIQELVSGTNQKSLENVELKRSDLKEYFRQILEVNPVESDQQKLVKFMCLQNDCVTVLTFNIGEEFNQEVVLDEFAEHLVRIHGLTISQQESNVLESWLSHPPQIKVEIEDAVPMLPTSPISILPNTVFQIENNSTEEQRIPVVRLSRRGIRQNLASASTDDVWAQGTTTKKPLVLLRRQSSRINKVLPDLENQTEPGPSYSIPNKCVICGSPSRLRKRNEKESDVSSVISKVLKLSDPLVVDFFKANQYCKSCNQNVGAVRKMVQELERIEKEIGQYKEQIEGMLRSTYQRSDSDISGTRPGRKRRIEALEIEQFLHSVVTGFATSSIGTETEKFHEEDLTCFKVENFDDDFFNVQDQDQDPTSDFDLSHDVDIPPEKLKSETDEQAMSSSNRSLREKRRTSYYPEVKKKVKKPEEEKKIVKKQYSSDTSSESENEESDIEYPSSKHLEESKQNGWKKRRTFTSKEEALLAIKSEKLWWKRNEYRTELGVKSIYDCRFSRKCQCPAKVSLICERNSQNLILFETDVSHCNHDLYEKTGLKEDTKQKIDDLVLKGVEMPKQILENIRMMNFKNTNVFPEPTTKQIVNYLSYKRKTSSGTPKIWPCKRCAKKGIETVFSTSRALKKHGVVFHPMMPRGPWTCEFCGKCIKTPQSIVIHRDNCGKEKEPEDNRPTCDICSMKFDTLEEVKTHSSNHSSIHPFQCLHCQITLSNSLDLKTHMTKVHPELVGIVKDVNKIKCQEETCEKMFLTRSKMRDHYRGVHYLKIVRSAGGQLDESDPLKSKCFKKGLRKCSHCGYLARSNNVLRSHLTKHSSIQKYHCDQCEQKFKNKDDLVRHKKRNHGDPGLVKRHKCKICPKSFVEAYNLKKHEEIHAGIQHLCDICGKTCSTSMNLRAHKSRHNFPDDKLPPRTTGKKGAGKLLIRKRTNSSERRETETGFAQVGNFDPNSSLYNSGQFLYPL